MTIIIPTKTDHIYQICTHDVFCSCFEYSLQIIFAGNKIYPTAPSIFQVSFQTLMLKKNLWCCMINLYTDKISHTGIKRFTHNTTYSICWPAVFQNILQPLLVVCIHKATNNDPLGHPRLAHQLAPSFMPFLWACL